MRTDGLPHAAANVVVVEVDQDQMGIIRETLAAEAVLPNAATGWDEAVDTILRNYPEVVIVDFEKDPDRAIALANELFAVRFRAVMIALTKKRDANMILKAVRAGFTDCIVLPGDSEQLRAAVHASTLTETDDEGKGLVIAVTGAKGGVGTTFLATHLATELASIHRVLCIDFDFNMGDVAPQMDIIAKDTLADVLPRAESMDERMLTGSVFVHPSKVHFLVQPNEIEQVGEVISDDIFNVLNAAASGYQYVIVDIGCGLDEAALTTLNVADQILLVTTPDVVAVRDAHRKLHSLNGAGVERKRINLILNKVPKQPYLTVPTIESNLGIAVSGQVAEDYKRVEHAVNEGKLLRELYPRADIVTDVARLVGLLSDDPEDVAAPTAAVPDAGSKGGFLSKLFNR